MYSLENVHLISEVLLFFRICMLGDRLLDSQSVTVNGTFYCVKNESSPIYQRYCVDNNFTADACDFYRDKDNKANIVKGIPGLTSGVFYGELTKPTS